MLRLAREWLQCPQLGHSGDFNERPVRVEAAFEVAEIFCPGSRGSRITQSTLPPQMTCSLRPSAKVTATVQSDIPQTAHCGGSSGR